MSDPNLSASPNFSVVIATYARGPLIEATLTSVARQTLAPREILVVSDGPAAPGLEAAVGACSGARLIELGERSRTQSGPNNEGWRQADGDWIAYLGHDDVWHPEHLASLARAISRRPDGDFSVSGLLFLGPDGSSDDDTWVTGFFDDDDRRAPLENFFPPSSFAHRRDLAGPRWADGTTTRLPVDADFLVAHAQQGDRFVSTGRITVVKFPSARRYLSYLSRDDSEQRQMLELSEDLAAFDAFLADKLAIARAQGTFMHMKQLDAATLGPGEVVARVEQTRGIDSGRLLPLDDSTWVAIGGGERPPDWHPLESDPIFEWRWSGPSVSPKLLVPFTAPESAPARVGIHVIGFADPELRDRIRVRVGAVEVPVEWEFGSEAVMSFVMPLRRSAPTIIEIITERTAPRGSEARQVGIAVTGFEIEPQAAFEARGGTRSAAAAQRERDVSLRRIDLMSEHPEWTSRAWETRTAELAALRQALDAVLTSRSWRMTRWYRTMGARFRRER